MKRHSKRVNARLYHFGKGESSTTAPAGWGRGRMMLSGGLDMDCRSRGAFTAWGVPEANRVSLYRQGCVLTGGGAA